MTVIYYRRNQNTVLTCEQLDSNFDALRERQNHTGTQLASTISDLYTTVEGYDFIQALQQCCEDLTQQLQDLQDSIFGDGELSTLITNLRNELLLEIAELQADLDALTLRVTTAETNIATINSSLASFTSAINALQTSKANINSPTFTGIPKAPTPLIGADPNQIVTVGYLEDIGGSLPIGSIIPYGGSVVPDANFMFANGQAISRSIYATLFSRFGTTYGSGDGSSTFNVPNLQQRVPVGVGSGYTLGTTGGSATHTLIENELPAHNHQMNHTHTINDPGHIHTYQSPDIIPDGERDNNTQFGETSTSTATSSNTTGITVNDLAANTRTGNIGGGAAHNNMQPYIVLNYIVKVK
jgi:microcystin-dependent protein